MGFLLFFISLIFSFIFYCFFLLSNGKKIFGDDSIISYKINSLSGNLLIETIIFFILGLFLLIYFSKFKFHSENSNITTINYSKVWKYVKIFFQKYLYYLGFLFFYLSIYLIFKSYNYFSLSYFILVVNIIISIFFFITQKFYIFKDLIKVNTIIFSIIYIVSYIYIMITGDNFINYIDFINCIFLLTFFILTISGNKFLLEDEKRDKTLISYFFVYFFILFSFYLNYILKDFLFLITINSFLFSVSFFYIFIKLKFFSDNKKTLKYLGLFSLYISSIFGIIYIIKNDFNIIVSLILLYGVIFNGYFHKKFENYVSLLFVFVNSIFFIYFCFFEYFYTSEKSIEFLIISLFISFSIIFYTYLYKLKYLFSYYFYHIISYIVNLYGIIYFFILGNFNILNLGIVMLIESVFIFLSYYKINSLKD